MKMVMVSVIYFVVVILLAHLFTPTEYDWKKNTISDLAAQGVKYQWIMQAGFIGFGILLNLGFIQKFITAQKIFYPDILIMFYGLAVLLTGFFSAAPYIAGDKFSLPESNIHSIFATLAGISFTAGIFVRLLFAPTPAERWQHAIFLVLVACASLGFGLAENGILPLGKGIVQRSLYLVSFIWLFISQA